MAKIIGGKKRADITALYRRKQRENRCEIMMIGLIVVVIFALLVVGMAI